ncbi:MAG: LysR family transcriptional regulator [Sphingobium sp.]|nr:LysR family transcriptional regulator [Sphingobium sp.]
MMISLFHTEYPMINFIKAVLAHAASLDDLQAHVRKGKGNSVQFVRYFVAVAKERHFARAAKLCGVSQPTLSAGLANLELELGKRLVVRDRRFVALTAEGEAILPWAQQLLAAREAMALAAESPGGVLHGELRIGIIPAAMPLSGQLVKALLAEQSEITISVRSLTSREIARGLAASELDAGVTYLDHEPLADALSVELYQETYLYMKRRTEGDERKHISCADALKEPLCILHQGMQNRRILDQRLAERGLSLHPRATADSYVALLSLVQTGNFATIIPDSYAALLPDLEWAHVMPFDSPLPSSRIGLIVRDQALLSPMASAALSAARNMQFPPAICQVIDFSYHS